MLIIPIMCRLSHGHVGNRLHHLLAVQGGGPLLRPLQQRDAVPDGHCEGVLPQEDAQNGPILNQHFEQDADMRFALNSEDDRGVGRPVCAMRLACLV